jgi:hypothetical protein
MNFVTVLSFEKAVKSPLLPLPKGKKVESFAAIPPKALPLKKGGREGFLGRPFHNAEVLMDLIFWTFEFVSSFGFRAPNWGSTA